MDGEGSKKYVPSAAVLVVPTKVDVPQRYAFTVIPARGTSLVSRIPLQLASQKIVPPNLAQVLAEAKMSDKVINDFRICMSFPMVGWLAPQRANPAYRGAKACFHETDRISVSNPTPTRHITEQRFRIATT